MTFIYVSKRNIAWSKWSMRIWTE